MIQEGISLCEPDIVSAYVRKGYTEVKLRKDIVEDVADDGPDGDGVVFWKYNEMTFNVLGNISVGYLEDNFDTLWNEHLDDDRDTRDIASEALELSKKSSNPQIESFAKMQVSKMDMSKVTETEVATISSLLPDWEPNVQYARGDFMVYDGKVYRASRDLTSQSIYPPGISESEYYEVVIAPDGIVVYRTCHGEYDAVLKGETRHYPDANGHVYRSIFDGYNAYAPDVVPDNWELVS